MPASHHSQCTLLVNKIACRDALQIHSHTHPSLLIFSPAPEKKTPKPWTKASNPRRTAPQRNARFKSEFSFDLLLVSSCDLALYLFFVFSFSLDLLPEEIIGTEDMPEYISSDSSLEAEDATPEQRISHQLRRRVGHLEHDLWDITARCQAERERRMALEALVGGQYLQLLLDSVLTLGSLPLTTTLSQMSLMVQ
jgi:hypothetical protein